jgi:hypothetical protein
MAFDGVKKCAISSCKEFCYGPCNLCRGHAVPGAVVCVGDGTGIVASWYAERDAERGLIVVDDLELGELFGGVEGFTTKLKRQGFQNVRILRNPEEVASARIQILNAFAYWSGPWRPQYPWETGTPSEYELN